MQDYPGLIISSARTLERNACSEIYYLLTEILGLVDVKAAPIRGISGLSIVSFSEDPVNVLKKIEVELENDPVILQYVLKLVPIQYKTLSDSDKLKEASKFFGEKISESVKWRINLRRRHTQLEREEIIETLASEIKEGEVCLDDPDIIIVAEVVGKWSYLAIADLAELSTYEYHLDDEKDDFTF